MVVCQPGRRLAGLAHDGVLARGSCETTVPPESRQHAIATWRFPAKPHLGVGGQVEAESNLAQINLITVLEFGNLDLLIVDRHAILRVAIGDDE